MNSIVIVQARTNSKRLPGKVLLTLRDIPIAVLAAKRAANTGKQVIVATSSEPSDDALAATASSHGLQCYRGSLNDTLARFVGALRDFDDETIVFRLTADNVLPDGGLLDEMECQFRTEKLDYLSCGGRESGLPYGLSVEVTKLAHLREAAAKAESLEDREHVTPFIIRKFGSRFFDKYKSMEMSNFRCTIDTIDDFIFVAKIFEDEIDPIGANWSDFLPHFVNKPHQPIIREPVTNFVLGGAQFGSYYGIANQSGCPDRDLAQRIIRTAIVNGIQGIDTARAYGMSEDVIGEALSGGWKARTRVFTKLSPLNDCPPDASAESVHAFVEASVFRTLTSLQLQKVDVLMLHRASHLRGWNGEAWRCLLKLRDDGWIDALGVSIQREEDLVSAISDVDVAHIQMPLNILDWRWRDLEPQILSAKMDRSLTIHARSAFLQGLLLSRNIDAWRRAHVANADIVWDWLERMTRNLGRASVADLCLSYVAGIPWIDGIVVGLEVEEQLIENLKLFTNEPLTLKQLEQIHAERPALEKASLTPSLWKTI